uniref:40S ribosomal protein S3 n=1 Tax=Arcella intermedia TaxID=1963864 RepID=A0A6B2LBL9_9EUKA
MLSPVVQAESLMFKILCGLSVERAANGVVRCIMENGARGVEVVLSGKLKGQRAKAQVFKDGYQLISAGDEAKVHVVCGKSHARLRSGVVGIKVKIFLPEDGKRIRKDVVKVLQPPTPKEHPLTFSYTGFKPLPPGWTPQANQTEKKKKKKKTQDPAAADTKKKDKKPKAAKPAAKPAQPIPQAREPTPHPAPSADRPAPIRGGRMGGRMPRPRRGGFGRSAPSFE